MSIINALEEPEIPDAVPYDKEDTEEQQQETLTKDDSLEEEDIEVNHRTRVVEIKKTYFTIVTVR